MKKRIEIIIAMLIVFSMILITKSNAAIETKANSNSNAYIFTTQLNAYQLSYDMRNPTSSLGNNTLDPHLELSKDFGAWAYLGMSAYGTNGQMARLTGVYSDNIGQVDVVATPNITGVVQSDEIVATVVGSNATSNQYGNSKYLEILETGNYTANNTKGMAMAETKGWYSAANGEYSEGKPVLQRNTANTIGTWCYASYAYVHYRDEDQRYFRPVIWN